jgi:polyisoprenoid-binding protein YceI
MYRILSVVLVASLVAACAADPAAEVPSAEVQPTAAQQAPGPAVAAPPAGAITLAYAAGSTIEMVGSKVTGSHTITLPVSQGVVVVAEGLVFSTELTFDMTTLEADHHKLTGHLRTDDFFDVDKFATARFVSTQVVPGAEGVSQVTGDLTIKGVTHVVSFPAQIVAAETGSQVTAEFSINRQHWGINYPGKSDDLIRDEVVVRFSLNAI